MKWEIIPETRSRFKYGRRAQRFAVFLRAVALFGQGVEGKRKRYVKS